MFSESEERTELEQLGEFGLINHLTKDLINSNKSTIKGVGDDAAVIDAGDKFMLVSTDMLVEGVHFDLMYAPMKHLGYKAVTVNLSDIYAMNGHPKQVTISLALSNRFSLEALDEFYAGVKLACDLYNVDVVGGDTTTSLSGLCISVTVIGEVEKEKIVYRSGANKNDLICVSGDLGAAYIGLQLLEREKQIFKDNSLVQPDLEGMDYILERQLKPEARKEAVESLEKAGVVPTAMIDISDGLASEISHLCKQSQKGVCIYEDKLPIEKQTFETAAEFSMDPNTAALNGGEDYELLFTIDQKDFEKMKNHDDITTIGYIHAPDLGKVMVTNNKSTIELTAQGWIHF